MGYSGNISDKRLGHRFTPSGSRSLNDFPGRVRFWGAALEAPQEVGLLSVSRHPFPLVRHWPLRQFELEVHPSCRPIPPRARSIRGISLESALVYNSAPAWKLGILAPLT